MSKRYGKYQSDAEKDLKWTMARLLYFHMENVNPESYYALNISPARSLVPSKYRFHIYLHLERRGFFWMEDEHGVKWKYIRFDKCIYDPLPEALR
jgi:hypothetical protein